VELVVEHLAAVHEVARGALAVAVVEAAAVVSHEVETAVDEADREASAEVAVAAAASREVDAVVVEASAVVVEVGIKHLLVY
jgi:hypothetical protein